MRNIKESVSSKDPFIFTIGVKSNRKKICVCIPQMEIKEQKKEDDERG